MKHTQYVPVRFVNGSQDGAYHQVPVALPDECYYDAPDGGREVYYLHFQQMMQADTATEPVYILHHIDPAPRISINYIPTK